MKVATWQNSQAILSGDSQATGLDASTLTGRRGEAMVRVDADDADPVATRLRIAPATAEHLEPVLALVAERRRLGEVETPADGPGIVERVLSVWPPGQRNALTRDLATSLNISPADLKGELLAVGIEQRKAVDGGPAGTSVGYRYTDLVGGDYATES